MITNDLKRFIKNNHDPIALVLGCYITGLGTIRELGRKGIPVIGLDDSKNQIGFYSRYCKAVNTPKPFSEENKYIDLLKNIGDLLNCKGVLIPSSDIEALAILKHRNELEKYYNFIMSDLSTSEKFINKSIFYKTLQRLDIKHPKTYYVKDEIELLEISKNIKYPCIIKPALSYYFRLDFNTKLFPVKSKNELLSKWKKIKLKNHEVFIQEIIPGEVNNMFGLNAYYKKNSNSSNNFFMYQRIREWPHEFGNGSLIKRVHIPELVEVINRLVKNIGYYGLIDAEFKRDCRDGSYKLIEINARSWMQNSFPGAYGFKISYWAYMDAIGKHVEYKKEDICKNDLNWVLLFDDIRSALCHIKKNELSFRQWLLSYYKCKKIHAYFDIKDPLPLMYSATKDLFSLEFLNVFKKENISKVN